MTPATLTAAQPPHARFPSRPINHQDLAEAKRPNDPKADVAVSEALHDSGIGAAVREAIQDLRIGVVDEVDRTAGDQV
jgi:hypothetical protein